MILGLQVLSTYCSGPNELLDEGKYGILVENSDDGLYDGMERILKIPSLITDYAVLSQNRSISFCLEQSVNDIETHL